MFKTIADVKKANKAIKNHWFNKETMDFFGTKIESELIDGKYFITSEDDFYRTKRQYRLRIVEKNGKIYTPGDGRPFDSLDDAKKELKKYRVKIKLKPLNK